MTLSDEELKISRIWDKILDVIISTLLIDLHFEWARLSSLGYESYFFVIDVLLLLGKCNEN